MNIAFNNLPYFDSNGKRHIPPYPHTYSTSAKGRWVAMPLIEAFGREFAVVGEEDATANTVDGPMLPSVSLDWVRNSLVYAQKMADDLLYVVRRETECQSAGALLVQIIKTHLEESKGVDNADQASKDTFFSKLPQLVQLRQLDEIRHVVTRREHPIDLRSQCIEIVSISREEASQSTSKVTISAQAQADRASGPPYFIAVNKPSSLSIHPGGRFHNNTLLRIIEDTFEGRGVPKKRDKYPGQGPDPSPLNIINPKCHSIPHLLVVDGRLASQSADGQLSTFICEQVRDPQQADQEPKGTWHPLLRIPHELVTDADRTWLFGFLPEGCVKSFSGQDSTNIMGVAVGAVECPLLPTHALEKSSPIPVTSSQPSVPKSALKLHIVHRLDRCTSGIIAFALDAASARTITESFADKEDAEAQANGDAADPTSALNRRHKRYLARVVGDIRSIFGNMTANNNDTPLPTPLLITSATYCTSYQQATYWCLTPGEQRLWEVVEATRVQASGKEVGKPGSKRERQPYASIEEKREAMRASVVSKRRVDVEPAHEAEGTESDVHPFHRYEGLKGARTSVRFVFYDSHSNESVVECTPLTGRTHQIRIHLASKGFPIVGDTKYMARGLAAECESVTTAATSATSAATAEDAPAICLHALQYTIPPNRLVRTDPPHWATPNPSVASPCA